MAKVSNKTCELFSSAIVGKFQPLALRVKTLTFDNGKEFAGHAYIDDQLQRFTPLIRSKETSHVYIYR